MAIPIWLWDADAACRCLNLAHFQRDGGLINLGTCVMLFEEAGFATNLLTAQHPADD
jgi:hypothetical protein